jgi:ATP-dependent DNA helicase Rep
MHTLNQPQHDAVRYLDGPLLVLAGAGSGKTRVITQKIAHLLQNCGYQAKNIAAITFTNKAAHEMQERVQAVVARPLTRGLIVSTFHALGLHVLRQEAGHLGYKAKFSILDSADAAKIISDIIATTDKHEIRRVQNLISRLKNDLMSPEQAVLEAQSEGELQLAKQYRAYQDTLFAYQAVDFDDLIRLPVVLFNTQIDVLHKWQMKLRYLLIDEYQDTNTCQYQLVKLLVGSTGIFTAVGDDDQSIYAWRGANMENLRLLQHDFPSLHVIKLEQNYRSTARILRAANEVIAHNPKLFEKKLWSELGVGDEIHVIECKDETHEAESVAMKLLAHKYERVTHFKDYAVLYRGNHQARVIEQVFRQHKIPYLLSGGQSFFDKSEIKDVMAYLRLIANENDDPAFIRAITTPKRGVGNATLEKLGAYAAGRHISLFEAVWETGIEAHIELRHFTLLREFCQFIQRLQQDELKEPAAHILQSLLLAIDYEAWLYDTEELRPAEAKWRNVQELVSWLSKKTQEEGKTLTEMVQTIALITLLEGRTEEEVDAVKLSTLHAAKGLEYGHVFLIGCEEEILPHRESVENGTLEEERRLMYVGITRAQRSLTITYCAKRKRARDWQVVEPSRFLKELPVADVRFSGRLAKQHTPMISKSEGSALLQNLLTRLESK